MSSPNSLVFGGIWTVLEADTDFAAAVISKNRIKVIDGTRSPTKPSLVTSDTPQVAVLPLGAKPHPFRTSSSSNFTSYWSIEMTSGTMKFETLADLEWIVYAALLEWSTTLQALEWLEVAGFVTDFRPIKADHDLVNRRKMHAPQGWRSLWVGQCDMWFGTTLLRT